MKCLAHPEREAKPGFVHCDSCIYYAIVTSDNMTAESSRSLYNIISDFEVRIRMLETLIGFRKLDGKDSEQND